VVIFLNACSVAAIATRKGARHMIFSFLITELPSLCKTNKIHNRTISIKEDMEKQGWHWAIETSIGVLCLSI